MQAELRARTQTDRHALITTRANARPVVAIGVSVGLALAACAGTKKAPQHEPAPPERSEAPVAARSSGELAQRNPDDLRSSSRPELDVNALTPRPVATPSATAGNAASAAHGDVPPEQEPAPITLEAARARPYALQNGEIVLASGLIIHRVPKGIAVRAGREQQTDDPVWEIVDRRGRRLALLKERSFRRASAASAPVLEETTTFRKRAQRNAWSRGPVSVIVERFHGEHSIYTVERLASGTDWIPGGLELRSPSRAE